MLLRTALLLSLSNRWVLSEQPLHPVRLAQLGDWPAPQQSGLSHGDIRAVVSVPANASAPVAARIFWRRRDTNPEKLQPQLQPEQLAPLQKPLQQQPESHPQPHCRHSRNRNQLQLQKSLAEGCAMVWPLSRSIAAEITQRRLAS